MDTKALATIAIFGAITIALNLSSFKIPAPFATYLIYQIWEIPIVAAFLIYGFKVGFSISIINTLVLLAVFPGELPTGPIYNLVAVLSTLLGLFIIQKSLSGRFSKRRDTILTIAATASGIIMRVGIMTVVNYIFLRFDPPIGFGIPADIVPTMLPVIGLFNATLALYTIPIGILIAKAVSLNIKIAVWI
jgi:riboflavin transporter FmnP